MPIPSTEDIKHLPMAADGCEMVESSKCSILVFLVTSPESMTHVRGEEDV